MTNAVFRTATVHDFSAMETLLTHAKLPVAGVAEMLNADASQFVVATPEHDESDIVAMAGLEVCCNHALLRSVAVHPEWQHRGLGHELVRRIVCEAETRGIRALYLLTLTAEHYFPQFGFESVGRDTVPPDIANTLEFTSACPASAIVMSRTLATV